MKTLRQKNPRRIQPVQTEAIHKVRISILRRKNYRPHKFTNNRHYTTTQGSPAINKMTMATKHFWWPKLSEAIQGKCDSCIPCKLSGKNLKPNIPKTEQNRLPPLSAPNEEIQLDFIGPITEENRRFYILLSMDRFSKWPAASLCKSTDGKTAVNVLQQYIQLNGIPKTIRTDKASAFTGH